MASYQRFLDETPESAMTPEAIRRIADLSLEKEYGYVASGPAPAATTTGEVSQRRLQQPARAGTNPAPGTGPAQGVGDSGSIAALSGESDAEFERRVAQGEATPSAQDGEFVVPMPEGGDDLSNPNAERAIVLYKELLEKYPNYERNDQVLYQMSRAYEELGQIEAAMEVMNTFVQAYPYSRYMDEVQFRRAEYYFTRNRFLDAEEAYKAVVDIGSVSPFYELSLYKLGWAYFKQDLYEEALNQYFALLDYKVMIGYDFEQTENKGERQRIEDTYRVVSLTFSYMGGPESVVDYFQRHGSRSYEDQVYSQLGEYYVSKRRYSDAASAYETYVDLNPFHEVAPHFNMRVIEIYGEGGFGSLVVEAKKKFSTTYALNAAYWNYYNREDRPDVIAYLKENLKDLANHYHAMYQDPRFKDDQGENYGEALRWYRTYLSSFKDEPEAPALNYQMADLMLENRDFGGAALAYETTSYNYPRHEQSSQAGYAAVYAYREHLQAVPESQKTDVRQKIISSSLRFADTYPDHEEVTVVLGAAADDLYEMSQYELAVATARRLLADYPGADRDLQRAAWLVVGHGSFDLANYAEAESGYLNVIRLTADDDAGRSTLYDNLAASIYKQGEEASLVEDYRAAADHFLRIGTLAPNSSIRPTAEYDAAAVLIKLEDWDRSAQVLTAFRVNFPSHELQPEVTKQIAHVYRSAGKLEQAAGEYERIEREADDDAVRRSALLVAAELYEEVGATRQELAVYRRFVEYFPAPIAEVMEVYHKMARVYQGQGDSTRYQATLRTIVETDRNAGAQRTDRTRYLAAQAALSLTEPLFDRFVEIRLVSPLKDNMLRKRNAMREAIDAYGKLVSYEVADVTAAATYYMAEIYQHFSQALMHSERPTNLSELELEQYELALEEQIYPFEEMAIEVHEKNIELLHAGIYSSWIDKSIGRLAELFPANYAREETRLAFLDSIDSYRYVVREAEPAGEEAPAADTTEPAAATPVLADEAPGAADVGASPVQEASIEAARAGEPND
ncbi:MAG TPA: tetratricopeptide repeat protein [Thioalkalivibrio sp.]|nr:tetratricopeptide repeat protein [Thioalkalivibrio sp.]